MQERAETEREQERTDVNLAELLGQLRRLRSERDRLVEALEEIVSTGGGEIVCMCDRKDEIAREALEAVEGDGVEEECICVEASKDIPGDTGRVMECPVHGEVAIGTIGGDQHSGACSCPLCVPDKPLRRAAPQDASAEDEYRRQWEIAREAPTSAVADNLAAIPDEKLSVGEQVTRDQAARRLRRGGGSGEAHPGERRNKQSRHFHAGWFAGRKTDKTCDEAFAEYRDRLRDASCEERPGGSGEGGLPSGKDYEALAPEQQEVVDMKRTARGWSDERVAHELEASGNPQTYRLAAKHEAARRLRRSTPDGEDEPEAVTEAVEDLLYLAEQCDSTPRGFELSPVQVAERIWQATEKIEEAYADHPAPDSEADDE